MSNIVEVNGRIENGELLIKVNGCTHKATSAKFSNKNGNYLECRTTNTRIAIDNKPEIRDLTLDWIKQKNKNRRLDATLKSSAELNWGFELAGHYFACELNPNLAYNETTVRCTVYGPSNLTHVQYNFGIQHADAIQKMVPSKFVAVDGDGFQRPSKAITDAIVKSIPEHKIGLATIAKLAKSKAGANPESSELYLRAAIQYWSSIESKGFDRDEMRMATTGTSQRIEFERDFAAMTGRNFDAKIDSVSWSDVINMPSTEQIAEILTSGICAECGKFATELFVDCEDGMKKHLNCCEII